MLSRSQRLTGDQVREIIAEKARIFHTPYFTIRFAQKNLEKSKFSVIVAKKIAKHAVDRNMIRRQIYSILAPIEPKNTGEYLFSVKKTGSFVQFSADIQDFFA